MVKNKFRIILMVILCAIIAISTVLAIGAISASCSGNKTEAQAYTTKTSKVMYYAEYLGETARNNGNPIPSSTSNEGLAEYPKYGSNLNSVIGTTADKVAARNAIIAESWTLCTINTRIGTDGYPKNTYNSMDGNGNLYLNGVATGRKLYKHSASVGMYLGDVADSEKGIVKRITFAPRSYSRYYNVTGVYAPAGEVIKIQISEKDMNATGGIVIHIGQALYNAKANNIWTAKNIMNRMPVILNTFSITKDTATLENGVYTAYVGSYLGGPIYVPHEGVNFSVTISGGVRYSHYIYGYTGEKEYEENAKSSAPYFDLEVWDNGVLHSGPKYYVRNLDYEALTKAAELWDKISLVSTKVSTQGIVFLYDPFVAAGAAVAFPGQGSVNCPSGWMTNSLSYDSFVNSGAWGNMHEYNHNFQSGWGRGNGGEVTNNALNIVEYSLFTNISSHRKLGVSGDGLSGWNRYTSPSWSLNQTLLNAVDGVNPEYPLNEYSTVIHNFGQQMFMDTIKKQRATGAYNTTYSGWYGALSETTHHDFTYFFSDILKVELDSEIADKIQAKNYPAFIPAASIYQTGRSFIYNEYEKVIDEDGNETGEDSTKIKSSTKMYCETAKPYVIPFGTSFSVDLSPYTVNENGQYESGSIVLPEGFTYKIKKVTSPLYGKIKKGKNDIYTFLPDKKHLESGKIYVTLRIEKEGEKTKFDDIELVLEFAQSHEINKNTIERTSYTYATPVYTDAETAFTSNYKGFETMTEEDNINPVQNCNSEVWYTSADSVPKNGVVEIKGKLYIAESGDYRLALRGRYNCALFVAVANAGVNSTEVKDSDYKLAASIKSNPSGNAGFTLADGTYKDYEDLEVGQWLYYKAVMICSTSPRISFIGVGWGKFENMGGTMDEDGNVTGGVEVEDPTIKYATAYRNSYEFPSGEFKTDYFYEHDYKVSYSNSLNEQQAEVSVLESSDCADGYSITNVLDGDASTGLISKELVTADNPFSFTVDIGENISANCLTFYHLRQGNTNYVPITFSLYVGVKADKLELLGEYKNAAILNNNVSVYFDETEFRYYKIIITDNAPSHRYVAFNEVKFSVSVPNGNLLGPKDEMFRYKGNWTYVNAFTTFGQVAVGDKKAKMEFEFTGTRVAIYSQFLPEYGKVTISVDGKKQVVDLSEGDGEVKLAFISDKLKEGKHKVVIKCKGKINYNVAAVGIWK